MEKTSEREKEIGAYGSEDQADEKPGLACRGHLGPVLSNIHEGQAEEQGREGREDQQNRRESAHRLPPGSRSCCRPGAVRISAVRERRIRSRLDVAYIVSLPAPSASPVREALIRRHRRRMEQERLAFRMTRNGTIMITDKYIGHERKWQC